MINASIEVIQNYWKLGKFTRFRPSYHIYAENEKYVIKTATKFSEFFQLLKLRYKIFLKGKFLWDSLINIDVDEFDINCDHIIIIDKNSKKVIGTYRVRPTTYNTYFYSQTEFNLNNFLQIPGEKLELGRACIHPDYRDGAVIDILWKGIGRYAKMCNARYLFGCSSVKTTEIKESEKYFSYLTHQNILRNEYNIHPIGVYARDLKILEQENTPDLGRALPPLLRSYINGGANVYGLPAFDLAFDCIDFFTIMDLANLHPSFKRRYF